MAARSAYDLYLTRSLRSAELRRAEGLSAAVELFKSEGLEALAGLKPSLIGNVAELPGTRVLDGRFTAIAQSIGGPGNNVYVTVLERSDSRRRPEAAVPPRQEFGRNGGAPIRTSGSSLEGATGEVLASTTIHVAAGPGAGPSRVAIVDVGGQRHLVRLALEDGPEDELPGRRVRLFALRHQARLRSLAAG